MNLNTPAHQVKALAGLFLACDLVKQIAWTGQCNQPGMQVILQSLLEQSPVDIDHVYGNVHNLVAGFNVVISQLNGTPLPPSTEIDVDVTRYAISLLHLERKLTRHKPALEHIGEGLEKVKQQLQHFKIDHPNILAKLADIYQQHISSLPPRIMVSGDSIHLGNPENANKIRALLLGGIRSAVLFRQCKGSKFKLLLKRKTYLHLAEQLRTQNG